MPTRTPAHAPTPVSAVRAAAPVRLLQLWHLLSLDAPTVAALWTWYVARAVGLQLPRAGLIAMFLAVWMLYAADRLLDARQLFAHPLHTGDLEARHLFHHRHATAFLSVIACAALGLALLLHRLLPQALELFALLGALLFAWFLLIHARATPSSAHRRLPKEIAVGLFFPAAIFIPTVARRPDLRLTLLPYALLFAAVCSLNCLAIYAWEHDDTNTAHWTTRYATRHLSAIAATIALSACAVAARSVAAHPVAIFSANQMQREALAPLALALGLSATILLGLHRFQQKRLQHVAPLTLRALADVALLTPFLFFWAFA